MSEITISNTDPSVDDLIELHGALRGHELLGVIDDNDKTFITYNFYGEPKKQQEEINIGNFATIYDDKLRLNIEFISDTENMPIWTFLKEKDAPISKYAEEFGTQVVSTKLALTLSTSKWSNSISPQAALKFLNIRGELLSDDDNIFKQIMTLISMLIRFYGGDEDLHTIDESLNSLSELLNVTEQVLDVNDILDQVDTEKYIPTKSLCIKRHRKRLNPYFKFVCGLPIMKVASFRPFARLAELQILHILRDQKVEELS